MNIPILTRGQTHTLVSCGCSFLALLKRPDFLFSEERDDDFLLSTFLLAAAVSLRVDFQMLISLTEPLLSLDDNLRTGVDSLGSTEISSTG
jgi:hypothetical protein